VPDFERQGGGLVRSDRLRGRVQARRLSARSSPALKAESRSWPTRSSICTGNAIRQPLQSGLPDTDENDIASQVKGSRLGFCAAVYETDFTIVDRRTFWMFWQVLAAQAQGRRGLDLGQLIDTAGASQGLGDFTDLGPGPAHGNLPDSIVKPGAT